MEKLFFNIFLQLARFTKVYCNSTGITCKNVFCKVRPISRFISFMDFGCDLDYPVDNFKVGLIKKFKQRPQTQLMHFSLTFSFGWKSVGERWDNWSRCLTLMYALYWETLAIFHCFNLRINGWMIHFQDLFINGPMRWVDRRNMNKQIFFKVHFYRRLKSSMQQWFRERQVMKKEYLTISFQMENTKHNLRTGINLTRRCSNWLSFLKFGKGWEIRH